MVYVKRYRKSCDRAECPLCYERWASKRAHAAARRLWFYRDRFGGREIHVVASPYPSVVAVLDLDDLVQYRKLKRFCLGAARRAGLRGGVAIFHPWRQRHDKSWYTSPHFHIVGFGWIINSEKILTDTGVLVKNLGIRKSVYSTIMYQLSHCGIRKRVHTLIWFGSLSYNKLKVPREVLEEAELCPLCLGPLRSLVRFGELGDPPDVEDEFIFPDAGWRVIEIGESLQVSIVEKSSPPWIRPTKCEYCGQCFDDHEGYEHHICPVGEEAEDW